MSTLTAEDLQAIGEYTVRIIGTSVMMGHDAPTSTTDYLTNPTGERWSQLVYDAFRACAVRPDSPDSSQALRDFVAEYNIGRVLAELTSPAVPVQPTGAENP